MNGNLRPRRLNARISTNRLVNPTPGWMVQAARSHRRRDPVLANRHPRPRTACPRRSSSRRRRPARPASGRARSAGANVTTGAGGGHRDGLVAVLVARPTAHARARRVTAPFTVPLVIMLPGSRSQRIMALARAAHRLGKHQHLERGQLAVRARSAWRCRHTCSARSTLRFDLLHRRHGQRIAQRHLQLLSRPGC